MSLDTETGRDRYFEARERELATFVDGDTGRVAEKLVDEIDCPICGSAAHERLFDKDGFSFVRCSDCALVFVNPRLKERILLDEYRTAQTNDLWFDVLTSEPQQALDREKFEQVLDLLEPYRGDGKLLDVGCSIGLLLELARRRGWEGLGLELAPRALAYARDHYGVDVREVPIADAGLEPKTFDAVVLLSVLEHGADPLALLRECARVLRAGGALYAIVPNVESLACRVLHEQARTFDGRNHLVYFSAATLADALDRSGFALEWSATRVSSLDAVLRHLAYENPYGEADTDELAALLGGRERLEKQIEELRLGYKLHCLATKRRA